MLARSISLFLLAAALPLSGCEMLSGGDKGKDGESVGYACRVSNKLPEDCMKENNLYTPTSILTGWKSADKDVKDKKVDKPATEEAAKTEGEPVPGAEPAAAEKPAEDKPATPEPEKH